MLAINHALTGAAIGLTISNPLLAAPVAFASHFLLDAVPHYDPPGSERERIGAKSFVGQLALDATLCLLLVIVLAVTKPRDWFLACICAFLAASPDLFWIPKFIQIKKTSQYKTKNLFLHFHKKIQWHTNPNLWIVETIYFAVLVGAVTALVPA